MPLKAGNRARLDHSFEGVRTSAWNTCRKCSQPALFHDIVWHVVCTQPNGITEVSTGAQDGFRFLLQTSCLQPAPW